MAGAWSDAEVLLSIERRLEKGAQAANTSAPKQWKSSVGDHCVCFPHFICTTRTCFAVTSVDGG